MQGIVSFAWRIERIKKTNKKKTKGIWGVKCQRIGLGMVQQVVVKMIHQR